MITQDYFNLAADWCAGWPSAVRQCRRANAAAPRTGACSTFASRVRQIENVPLRLDAPRCGWASTSSAGSATMPSNVPHGPAIERAMVAAMGPSAHCRTMATTCCCSTRSRAKATCWRCLDRVVEAAIADTKLVGTRERACQADRSTCRAYPQCSTPDHRGAGYRP